MLADRGMQCSRKTLGRRPVLHAGEDVVAVELGVVFEEFFDGGAGGEEVEDEGDPEAGAFHARLAEADVGVDGDALQQRVHARAPARQDSAGTA